MVSKAGKLVAILVTVLVLTSLAIWSYYWGVYALIPFVCLIATIIAAYVLIEYARDGIGGYTLSRLIWLTVGLAGVTLLTGWYFSPSKRIARQKAHEARMIREAALAEDLASVDIGRLKSALNYVARHDKRVISERKLESLMRICLTHDDDSVRYHAVLAWQQRGEDEDWQKILSESFGSFVTVTQSYENVPNYNYNLAPQIRRRMIIKGARGIRLHLSLVGQALSVRYGSGQGFLAKHKGKLFTGAAMSGTVRITDGSGAVLAERPFNCRQDPASTLWLNEADPGPNKPSKAPFSEVATEVEAFVSGLIDDVRIYNRAVRP